MKRANKLPSPLLASLTRRCPEMVLLLRQLVEQESPSFNKPAVDSFAQSLARTLAGIGARVQSPDLDLGAAAGEDASRLRYDRFEELVKRQAAEIRRATGATRPCSNGSGHSASMKTPSRGRSRDEILCPEIGPG